MTRRAIRTGMVSDFDDPRGLGTVLDDDDGRRYGFHCTAIADGTRRIDVGARVTFLLAPGHLGRVEARAIAPSGVPSETDSAAAGVLAD